MGDSDGKSLLPGRAAAGPHPEKQELVAKTVARQVTTSGDEQVDAAAQRQAGDAAVASGLAAFADAEEACRSKFPMSTDAVRLTVRKAVESARGAFASAVAQEKEPLHGPALETYRRKLDDSMAEWTGRDSDGTPGEVAVEIVEGSARLVRVRAASGRCAQLVEDNHRAILQASRPSHWSPCVAGHHVTDPHCGDARCRSNGARMRSGVRRCFRSTPSGSPAAAHCAAERRGVGRVRCASARARARRAMRLRLGGGFRCSVRRCAPGGAPRGRTGAGGGLLALPRRRAAPCGRAGRAASRHARRGSSHSRGAGGGGCREGAQGDGGAAAGRQGVAAARAQGGAGPGARRGGAAGGGPSGARTIPHASQARPRPLRPRPRLPPRLLHCLPRRRGRGAGAGASDGAGAEGADARVQRLEKKLEKGLRDASLSTCAEVPPPLSSSLGFLDPWAARCGRCFRCFALALRAAAASPHAVTRASLHVSQVAKARADAARVGEAAKADAAAQVRQLQHQTPPRSAGANTPPRSHDSGAPRRRSGGTRRDARRRAAGRCRGRAAARRHRGRGRAAAPRAIGSVRRAGERGRAAPRARAPTALAPGRRDTWRAAGAAVGTDRRATRQVSAVRGEVQEVSLAVAAARVEAAEELRAQDAHIAGNCRQARGPGPPPCPSPAPWRLCMGARPAGRACRGRERGESE